MEKILEMKKITKRFPGVLALNQVDLTLNRGEILALLGENGAGKSTLIKILGGAYHADSGEIFLNGKKVENKNPAEMMKMNIAVMHQELNYLNDLSIAENIFLGKLPKDRMHRVDYKELKVRTKELLDMVGLQVDPMTEVSALSVAQKQMMEIAKVLSNEISILVMDEPTSALNETEVQTLFKLIRMMVEQGKSIIYISHKMDEIFQISDRIQVLRDGCNIGTLNTKETNTQELVAMMVGRSIDNIFPKSQIDKGETVLEVDHLEAEHIKDVSFSVKAGEIVGLFGLMGSGRTEIAETIFGKRLRKSGEVKIDGKTVNANTPKEAIRAGIAYIPRERKSEGLILTETVKNNMSIAFIDRLQKVFRLDTKKERELVNSWIKKLRIKTPGIHADIENLSGGNQQKVVIGKWMMGDLKLVIFNEPTRGIDVGAKVEIYNLIEDLCKLGLAVLIISSETPEIMGISDRILVVHEGKITGECSREEFKQETIMYYAVGGKAYE